MAEGEINELHVGLKGTMNALFFKDLCENAPNLDPAQWNDHQPEPAILS